MSLNFYYIIAFKEHAKFIKLQYNVSENLYYTVFCNY